MFVVRSEILKNLTLWLSSNSIITIVSVYLYRGVLKSNKQMGLGWSASIQVTLAPHILLLFLAQGIGPLQSFHLSITWWNYYPLERIITSLSLPWGIITPWRGLSPLSRYPLISPTITLVDYHPRHKVTCRPLLEYHIPYPFSPQLFWFSYLLP